MNGASTLFATVYRWRHLRRASSMPPSWIYQVINNNAVSVIEQPLHDPAAHVADANESEFNLIGTEKFHIISV
jgi:hypothetical protein